MSDSHESNTVRCAVCGRLLPDAKAEICPDCGTPAAASRQSVRMEDVATAAVRLLALVFAFLGLRWLPYTVTHLVEAWGRESFAWRTSLLYPAALLAGYFLVAALACWLARPIGWRILPPAARGRVAPVVSGRGGAPLVIAACGLLIVAQALPHLLGPAVMALVGELPGRATQAFAARADAWSGVVGRLLQTALGLILFAAPGRVVRIWRALRGVFEGAGTR